MNELLKFLTLIVNINLVLGVDNKLYPQICLDECFMSYKFCTKNLTLDDDDDNNNNNNNYNNNNNNDNDNDNDNDNKNKDFF